MKTSVWPPPLYSFLDYITNRAEDPPPGKKILDCGAGGELPPLALFKDHGFETYGIDISEEQIKKAGGYCNEYGVELDIRKGDMRDIPFDDETFNFVYEYCSMPHMTKEDTAVTINEITRVAKKGGYCFMGFILNDTWPLLGRERQEGSGEFWGGDESEEIIHSVFTEEEAEGYLTGLEIIRKDIWITSETERLKKVSWDDWQKIWDTEKYPEEGKRRKYEQRIKLARYSHIFYILRRPIRP
jgi:ubiquinone/menaquinone biosynthesis C-methylase UbiE